MHLIGVLGQGITDGMNSYLGTGLMWINEDSGPVNWEDTLSSCEKMAYAD